MSHGDLSHPMTIQGRDELAVLADQMDNLRITLQENNEKEINDTFLTLLENRKKEMLSIVNKINDKNKEEKMKVIVIMERQGEGLLAVAKDVKSAIKYLIENKWIEEDDTYLVEYEKFSIIRKFGKNWEDTISNMSINEFNEFFRFLIYLEEKEVYE